MEKHSYIGKTLEDAINKAKLDLQETEDNLIIVKKRRRRLYLAKK